MSMFLLLEMVFSVCEKLVCLIVNSICVWIGFRW